MAPQLPAPEKFTEALAGLLSFPPKLAPTVELLAEPERIFEEQMAAMGMSIPPGPTRMLAQTLSGIEATLPALAPSQLPAPTAPTTPTIPAGESLGEAKKVEVSQPKPTTRAREQIEIIEV